MKICSDNIPTLEMNSPLRNTKINLTLQKQRVMFLFPNTMIWMGKVSDNRYLSFADNGLLLSSKGHSIFVSLILILVDPPSNFLFPDCAHAWPFMQALT